MGDSGRSKGERRFGLAAAVAVAVGAALAAGWLPVAEVAAGLVDRLAGLGPWGPVVFGLAYALAVVLMVPASALTLAAGAAFGPVVGTITVVLASNLGASAAFLIARHLARDAVARRVRSDPRFEAIDRAIAADGWKVVGLLRLSPLVPFNLQNYLYGLTAIPFRACALASLVAMLPGTWLYIALGNAGRVAAEAAGGSGRRRTPGEWVMLGVGLAASLALAVEAARRARRAIRRSPDLTTPGPPGG
jgi:uncharacterized membrane protein YdjX (TVP38/TMEM64 family)